MSRRPIIGVAWPQPDYVTSLEQAGAEVKHLRPDADPLPAALEAVDGVLLTGGVDVDPIEYGDAERHPTVELDPTRDRYELAIAREALARNLPLFAICRGAQVLNVAAGGTLIQDIPTESSTALPHSVTEPKDATSHDVTVAPQSCLAVLMGPGAADGHLSVNSRHHQSVRAVAPGFIVSATAPDGVIEAIEKPGAPFCLGVQWHPENFWRKGEFRSLFEGFVRSARNFRATITG